MNVKIKGNFKKIIFSKNNFNVVSFQIHPNQNEMKEILEISSNTKYMNVICKELDFDNSLDYEIEINVEKSKNEKYKNNYFVTNKTIIIPNEKDGLIRYFSSSLFKGISTKTATKLVENFGNNLIEDFENKKEEIEKLIGQKKTNIIINGISNNAEFNEILKIFIQENFSVNILNQIKGKIKNKIRYFMENDLFSIIDYEEIQIDFFDLDKIAKYFLKNYNEKISNETLIMIELYKLEFEGSTVNEVKDLFTKICSYKNISISIYKECLKSLFEKNKIIIHENKKTITSKKMFEKEKYICNRLIELKEKESQKKNKLKNNELIKENLDEIQQEAILKSLTNSVSIITGGPGTGKTLLINLIMKNLKKMKFKNIEILAPTGKAATQISSKTLESAKTFHSFLKWNEKTFDVNEKNPSNVKIIIIDEFSMININLFYSLLIACPKLEHLIIVGDKDQLPPIGPGYLLNDFIESNKIITTKLNKIYRQSEGSLIAQNSVKIKNGIMPSWDNKESLFFDIDENEIEKILFPLIDKEINSSNSLMEFQILIPMYNYSLGIDKINVIVQNHINKSNDFLFKINEKKFFKYDKVIQLENDNEKGVFNGEIGQIINSTFKEHKIEKIEIIFDNNRCIEYTPAEFNANIKLAYAISVHKFQGSECKKIFLIFSGEHKNMFTRKLFYTAYTRARNVVYTFSKKSLIQECINNNSDANRKSNILNLLNAL